jgi:Tfp pilus assembly protein PilX
MKLISPVVRNERGVALVMALLVLLVLSLLAAVLMLSINVDTKITGHGLRETDAFNVAQAGLSEAMTRLSDPTDIALPNNPRAVVQIFNVAAGSVPVLGVDSTAYSTGQPAGAWLGYSTATRDTNALTITYKTDPARTLIYKYDSSLNPAVQTTSGLPIYVVTATGQVGGDHKRVRSEIIQRPIIVNAKGAFVAQVGVNCSGASVVCGYNHRADTPTGTGASGRTGAPPCDTWEVGSGDMPGVWSADSITTGGSSLQYGTPATSAGQAGFYTGPWDVFSMSQAEFFSWVGPPVSSEPGTPKGIYYLDNNGVSGDGSGKFAYQGADGEGFMYVDGDMSINGNFTYRGLIYITGDLKINGTCWILGGLVVKGNVTVKLANGNCTVLYSGDAITQNVTKYGGTFTTLSWRELP